jgi:hypothetical protein
MPAGGVDGDDTAAAASAAAAKRSKHTFERHWLLRGDYIRFGAAALQSVAPFHCDYAATGRDHFSGGGGEA